VLLAATVVLAVVSWIDDLRGLSPAARIVPQIAAVAAALAFWPADALVFQGWLPLWLDRVLAGLAWLWFLNLFNFMDGIDALAGTEAASIGSGLALVTILAGGPATALAYGLTLAAAAGGFLLWNRPPARIFLGDVGSIPLGYLLGWLLLDAAAHGGWAVALILPAYYLADATLTLLRRLARGSNIFASHAEHFYQLAVRRRLSHGQAVRAVLLANLVLIALAIGAAHGEALAGLIGAAATVALLLRYLARPKAG
jgi:UDP-N-acetylmuramyl pentapeptide phosphotransferase/UDP-N-acetylglucosamine-1-phosphate transferase